MKLLPVLVIACALAACSQSQEDTAREQARQTAEQLKRDSEKAFREADADARRAGDVVNQDLEKAREKARKALDQSEHPDHPGDR